jgi:hypothetical protein
MSRFSTIPHGGPTPMDVDHYRQEHKYVLKLDIGLKIVNPNLTTFDMFILSIHPILMLAILSLVGIVENRDIQKEIVMASTPPGSSLYASSVNVNMRSAKICTLSSLACFNFRNNIKSC